MPWTFHTKTLNAKVNRQKSKEWLSYQLWFSQSIYNLLGNFTQEYEKYFDLFKILFIS